MQSLCLAGTSRSHSGLIDNMPDRLSCVVVANHASYVDGFLLKGYLPARFSFRHQRARCAHIPLVHFLLRRAGSRVCRTQ